MSHIVLLILVMPHLLHEMKSFLDNLFMTLLKPQRFYVCGIVSDMPHLLTFLTICSSLKYKFGNSHGPTYVELPFVFKKIVLICNVVLCR